MEFTSDPVLNRSCFDVGYDTLCQKHAEGESLDKDFYEYVCDSILAEADMTIEIVKDIIQSFYPDYSIDDDDVSYFINAATNRNSSDIDIPTKVCTPVQITEIIESESSSEEESEVIWTEKNVEEISFISSVFPTLDISIIEFVYMIKCAKNKEPAVEYLLENCSDEDGINKIIAKMAEKVDKKQREIDCEAQAVKAMQAAVFQKYGDQAIKYRGGEGKKSKKDQKVDLVLENSVDNKPRKTKVSRLITNENG